MLYGAYRAAGQGLYSFPVWAGLGLVSGVSTMVPIQHLGLLCASDHIDSRMSVA